MSAEEIHRNLLKNIDGKFDKSSGSWTYDVQKSTALEMAKLEVKNENIIDKINVENLTGEELERFVFQRTGVKKRGATFASDKVKITVTGPTVIEKGALVAAEDIFYEVDHAWQISLPGEYLIDVICQTPGVAGNVPVGAISSFPVTLNNVSLVTNEVAFTNGYDAESDASLRQRYYDKLQRPGKAGNKDHYREWALEVPGVGKVKVFPRWAGPLTVKVAILDINNDVAPQLLIDTVYDYISSQMPFGANLTVVTATDLVINLSASYVLKSGYDWTVVKPLIEARLSEYYREISFEEGLSYLSHAQIGREILSTEGVMDYSNLLLNGSSGNIAIGETEIPKVGGVSNV